MKASEKLQEMDREYEMSLHAISEKDNALTQKTMNLHLLQKQVREAGVCYIIIMSMNNHALLPSLDS